ncbi:hypothetical protein BKA81DRAFT_426474 [Phyllosticta paracitricarpa]
MHVRRNRSGSLIGSGDLYRQHSMLQLPSADGIAWSYGNGVAEHRRRFLQVTAIVSNANADAKDHWQMSARRRRKSRARWQNRKAGERIFGGASSVVVSLVVGFKQPQRWMDPETADALMPSMALGIILVHLRLNIHTTLTTVAEIQWWYKTVHAVLSG